MSQDSTDANGIDAVLPQQQRWSGPPGDAELAALPACPAVVLLTDEARRPVALLSTQDLRRLVQLRLAPQPARRGRADLAAIVRGVDWRPVHSRFEADWRYYLLARQLHPGRYRTLVSFGPAWFLHLVPGRPVPQLGVTERVYEVAGRRAGPWPTQAACRQTAELLCDLFDLCRYPDELRRAPRGSRCAYYDMGRCDAPCDGSAAPDDMLQRTYAAWRFATGGAAAWLSQAQERMRRAAEAQHYERAALLKRQIAVAQRWVETWGGRVRDASEWVELLLVPATRRRAMQPLLFRQGTLVDGPIVPQRSVAEQAAAWAAELLGQPPPQQEPLLRTEQAWLVAKYAHRPKRAAGRGSAGAQHGAAARARRASAGVVTVPIGSCASAEEIRARIRDALEESGAAAGAEDG